MRPHSRSTTVRRAMLVLAACTLSSAAVPLADADPVRVRIRDASSGDPVAARAYLWRGADAVLPAGVPTYDREDERHFLVDTQALIDLAPGSYRLRVERGPEYVPAEITINVPAADPVEVRLARWIDLRRSGWYPADMHVHRNPADLPLILRAEDLTFVPAITTHVWGAEVNQPWKPMPELVTTVEPGRFFTSGAQEIERIQGGPGAVILLGSGLPLPFSGYERYPPSSVFTRVVKDQGGFVEGDKPFWVDTFVNALSGQVDAVELNCNHFMPRSVDMDLARWSHWPMEFGYRGERGFAEWMMATYYRLLNAGIELPLSAGTASGVKGGPVGFNRVYVRTDGGTIDYDGFIESLRAGRSFTTNGPAIDFDVDGATAAGARITLEQGKKYHLRAKARWRAELERVQLVVNGEVVAEQGGGNAGELVVEHTLRPTTSVWVAARAFARTPRHEAWERVPVIFAHTSPAYLRHPGEPVLVRQSLEELLVQANTLVAHMRLVEGFRSESDRQETLDLYRAARDLIASRLAQATARPSAR